jgi:hypothetical protein
LSLLLSLRMWVPMCSVLLCCLTISWNKFVRSVNAYKAKQRELDIWVGEDHSTSQGNYLTINLNTDFVSSNPAQGEVYNIM